MEFIEVGAWVAYFGAEKTVELVPKRFGLFWMLGLKMVLILRVVILSLSESKFREEKVASLIACVS